MKRAALMLGLSILVVSLASAQQIWVGGWGNWGRGAVKWAQASDFDGSFLFCRAAYSSGRGRGGWSTDYPGADNNFSVRLAELTHVRVKLDAHRQPNHVVVPLSDPLLYRCPMLFMTNPGAMALPPEEVFALRTFFQKGGFLWVDDYWGTRAWTVWASEIGRVLPPSEFPIFDVPPTHPVMRTVYEVKAIPQVPNIGFWRGTGGRTSEQGHDSRDVHFRGIQDSRGRLMVLMTHNTDIFDTWEREGEEPREYFDRFSPTGYAIGVNILLYAMTH